MSDFDAGKVLDYLRKYGWHQDGYFAGERGRSAACLLGACRATDQEMLDGYRVFGQIIAEQFPERVEWDMSGHTDVVSFNDHPDTTFADIELICEKAAAR